MKIIDFDRKGNVVRFYLGEKTEEWGWTNPDYKDWNGNTPSWLKPSDTYYGDDWDDRPYDCNAGRVYDQFVKGHKDIAFDFDDYVLEPCDGVDNSNCCKDDMAARMVPCLIVVPKDVCKDRWVWNFYDWVGCDGVKKYYFGDEM